MRSLFFLMLLSAAGPALAYELEGEWRVDLKKTFAAEPRDQDRGAKLFIALMKCQSEHETLRFQKGYMSDVVAAHSCTFEGKTAPIEGAQKKLKYAASKGAAGEFRLSLANEAGEKSSQSLHWLSRDSFRMDLQPGEAVPAIVYVRKERP